MKKQHDSWKDLGDERQIEGTRKKPDLNGGSHTQGGKEECVEQKRGHTAPWEDEESPAGRFSGEKSIIGKKT